MKGDFRQQKPLVSIIIPTRNSAETLSACLKSVVVQSYPFIEVIVVDGYSDDETVSLANLFGAKIILCKGTQAAARNAGIAFSKGDYILFLDSDQQLSRRVVEECISMSLEHGVEAVKIPEKFVGTNFIGRCSALWKNRMVEAWGLQGGIPRFYRRSALYKSAAFKNGMRFWEDLELYTRLKLIGLKEAWCKSWILHYEPKSLRSIIVKYVAYGKSASALREKSIESLYASTLKLTLFTLRKMLRKPESPTLFFGCLLLITVKVLSLLLGYVLSERLC